MATESNSCARELKIEVPTEAVERETQRVTREFVRLARLPGFRPGKAPAELVRRRFWDDIRSEVLHALIPASLEDAFREKNLKPVGRPAIDDLEFEPAKPLRFKATFEVLPDITLADYRGLEIEPARIELADSDLEQELEALREQAATYVPVEERAAQNGDTVVTHLMGIVTAPEEQRPPIVLDDVMVHLGAESTLEAFNEALMGAGPGDEHKFSVTYPQDYPEASLAGRTVGFTARVKDVKRKELPALDDDFARQVGDYQDLDDLKAKLRQRLEEARARREQELTRQRLLDALLARHDFPVPEALVERQLDVRLERQVRALMAQGLDPRRVDVDWGRVRRAAREPALRESKLALLLDRIAAKENIEVSEEDVSRELERLAPQSRESPEALRARLTREGGLDRIKNAIRSEKVVEFLRSHARPAAPNRG